MQRDLVYAKMRQNASEVSAQITHAHMQQKALDFQDLHVADGFLLGLYDQDKKALLDRIGHPVDFRDASYEIDGHLGVVDESAFGHKGVFYVVVEELMFDKMLAAFTWKMIAVFVALFFILSLVGYGLAKLFIKPIVKEREKLDTFIKDSTHELNTPITALLMSTSAREPASEKNIQRIRFSAKRISELYEDLTYLFLREHEKPVEKIALDVLFLEQVAHLQAFAQKKSIMIESSFEPFSFLIDKESATRLFNNLLSNAIKYSDKGDRIEIRLQAGVLTIKDSGIGIEQEKLDDIFARFYRATSTRGGFGIGLDMVRTIAQKYAIMIAVESDLGEGTTFTLTFPQR